MGHGADSECSTSGMIVEELLAGSEVDVDCIVQDGQLLFACLSDNHPPGGEVFVETGGRCPSTLPPSAQAQLLLLTRDVAAMFPGLSGVMHFEAMYSDKGPVPIELNARIGGAETPVQASTHYAGLTYRHTLCVARALYRTSWHFYRYIYRREQSSIRPNMGSGALERQ
ncbi:ATP-grasp domain-containing protein [Haematococcus lacustris]|uniref:ATP-grasp domain-containing protein n=1 Tax=Haematococcus lacustris TaxID=44745 RepID=A0A699YVF0_HAELA|nr:ATP-grasp domain-containing protein [Haematococcus lacustris]